jgi:hypothetical protein
MPLEERAVLRSMIRESIVPWSDIASKRGFFASL